MKEQIVPIEKKGLVFDIRRFSTHDGPGLRTTVFTKGCPLRCKWCQNPEGLELKQRLWHFGNKCIGCGVCIGLCPKQALSFSGSCSVAIDESRCDLCGLCAFACPPRAFAFDSEEKTVQEVMEELAKDEVFYGDDGGITLSGGDPFRQKGFCLEILRECKARGFHTAVETCLHVDRAVLEEFLPYLDLLIADCKAFDPVMHKAYTSQDNALIMDNFVYLFKEGLKKYGTELLVRIPLIPEYTATEENLKKIAVFFRSLSTEAKIELINYNPLARNKYLLMNREYPFNKDHAMYSEQELEAFRGILSGEGLTAY